jgi:hypothetical protein
MGGPKSVREGKRLPTAETQRFASTEGYATVQALGVTQGNAWPLSVPPGFLYCPE